MTFVILHFITFPTLTLPKVIPWFHRDLELSLGYLFTGNTGVGVSRLILRTSHVTRAGNEWTVPPSGRESIRPAAPWKLCRWPSPWRPTCSFTTNPHTLVRFRRRPRTALDVSVYVRVMGFMSSGPRYIWRIVDDMLSIWHLRCDTQSRCWRVCSEGHIRYGFVWLLNCKGCDLI